jgi:hypothetical protein
MCGSHFKEKENNGGDKPNWSTLYANVELSQQTLLNNYYILIKTFLKRTNAQLYTYHT